MDPSHLFWQGIDPTEAVKSLGSLVYNAAAKDTRINALVKVNGALDDSFTHVGAEGVPRPHRRPGPAFGQASFADGLRNPTVQEAIVQAAVTGSAVEVGP